MHRILLIIGLVALGVSILPYPAVLSPGDEVLVEVYSIDPDTLELPVPALEMTPTAAPSPTAMPTVARTPWTTAVVIQAGVGGYQGCTDTVIDYYSPDANACTSPSLMVATVNKAASLVRFDLTKLPTSAVGLGPRTRVMVATLSLFAVQTRSDMPIGLYVPRQEWMDCTTTWTLPWQEPGADGALDREAQPRVETRTSKASEWIEFDATELVQNWLRDPATNYGVLLKSFDSRPQQHIYFSSDHPAVTLRPRLVIQYEPYMPSPTPTPRAPTATPLPPVVPGPILSAREVEVRWPSKAFLGQPYDVRIVFRPSTAQAMMASEPSNHVLVVMGSLSAPGFEVTSSVPVEQALEDPAGSLTWLWNATPRREGPQALSIDLVFAWKAAGAQGPVIKGERGVWYRTRISEVVAPVETGRGIDTWRAVAAVAGALCILASLLSYWQARGKAQANPRIDSQGGEDPWA